MALPLHLPLLLALHRTLHLGLKAVPRCIAFSAAKQALDTDKAVAEEVQHTGTGVAEEVGVGKRQQRKVRNWLHLCL